MTFFVFGTKKYVNDKSNGYSMGLSVPPVPSVPTPGATDQSATTAPQPDTNQQDAFSQFMARMVIVDQPFARTGNK